MLCNKCEEQTENLTTHVCQPWWEGTFRGARARTRAMTARQAAMQIAEAHDRSLRCARRPLVISVWPEGQPDAAAHFRVSAEVHAEFSAEECGENGETRATH